MTNCMKRIILLEGIGFLFVLLLISEEKCNFFFKLNV